MKNAIEVRNLSKKYSIHHEGVKKARSLRELFSFSNSSLQPRAERLEGKSSREDFWALKDISFEVSEGQRIAVIGGNGAGKSTLLKLLSRITEPTNGSIKIRGKLASLLEVGTGFHPELTGRENIFLNGAILGMRHNEIMKKFDSIVAFSGVEKFIDTPVKHYSSGMYVRLAFSVSAWLNPDILIVDEVLSVGDMAFQKRCAERMKELTGDGKTVIFVSHSMDAVKSICERAICLNKGEIIFEGAVDQAVDNYRRLIDDEIGEFSMENLSLETCTKRGGSGEVRIDKLEINERDFSTMNPEPNLLTIKSGEDLNFRIKLRVNSVSESRGISVALAIDSEFGDRIFTAISEWYGKDYSLNSKETEAIAHIKNLNLRSGRYRVSLSVILGGVTLDSIVDCAAFQLNGDPLLGGIPFSSDFGMANYPVTFS
ncbi:ABC transporter ATP-binding protein [Polynucleobacter paneuropaeus]|nr:ABC transporter ATP-binding protein [Polynucleobacter paneuropaeus]